MAWFGEGLSSLKGQISNFTKEVLSEGRDEIYDTNPELTVSKRKVQELEALCASQDLEISELKQRNAELQRRLGAGSTNHTEDGWQIWEPPQSAFQNQDDLAHARQELAEKTQLVDVFRQQLDHLKLEKQHVNVRCSQLEEEVQKLSKQLEKQAEASELEHLRSQLSQTGDENVTELKEQLKFAELRIEELEKEVERVHQQMLEQLSDSQMNTSEIRGEVEQTRWQLLHESGTQKTELLRARQDMVNRIIQMGEKSREVEMNMKKLQLDGKHLTADITAIIHKLGDPEQQELIHGTLKALELENQVLKLRNAQLELAGNTESLKGSRKCEEPEVNSRHQDAGTGRPVDDCDTASLKSEVSELSELRQKLETQVTELETQVDKYERDIECFEAMRTDWTEDMRQQLKEKEDKLSIMTAQKGLMDLKKQAPDEKRVQELNKELCCLKEEKEQLQQGKVCLSSELEAMAKIVQDLESQLAKAQEENASLSHSLEELDEQHQGAVDQLLNVKQSLQKQNDALQSEVDGLRKQHAEKTDAATESSEPARLHNAVQTKDSGDLHEECRRNLEAEFQEKISKLITFEIPQNYFSFNNNNDMMPMGTIEALVKMCVECKWKRDTLERKVAELMKELRENKHKYEERDRVAREMEAECKVLKGNVETLIEDLMVSKSGGGEALAPIPENSEEAEMMEQRIASLESEVEVLREARSNLEADAKKLRDQEQVLIRRLEMTSAALRNQENLETELRKSQETTAASDVKLQELISAKQRLEEEVRKLQDRVNENSAVLNDQENLKSEIAKFEESAATAEFKLQEEICAKEFLEEQLNKFQDEVKLSVDAGRHLVQEKVGEIQAKLESVHGNLVAAEQTIHSLRNEKEVLQKQLEKEQSLKNELEDTCKNSHVSKQLVHTQEELLAKIVTLQEAVEISDAEKKKLEESCRSSHVLRDALEDQDEMKVAIEDKTSRLEEATLKISQYEQLSQNLESQLNVYVQDLDLVKAKLVDCETRLETTLKSKSVLEGELSSTQTTLKEKDKEISELKYSYNALEIDSDSNQDIIQSLNREKLELEEKLKGLSIEKAEAEYQRERSSMQDHEAMSQEIKKWKEMAEGSERQLNEVLQVRAELEQECGRLYSIETKVQNQEHLVRELNRLRETSEELEQKCNELSSENKNLEAQRSNQAMQISETEMSKQDALDKVKEFEQKLEVTLQQTIELQMKCQALEGTEEKLKSVEQEGMKRKEVIINLQQELGEAMVTKSSLEAECKRLLAVEGKLRNQESLEAEVRELQDKLVDTEQKLSEMLDANLQLEEICKILEASHTETGKVTQIGNVEGQVERRELSEMQNQVDNVLTERQRILAVLDEKTRENGLLKAENARLLEMISEQKSAVARLEEERKFQDNEAAQMVKETVGNLSEMIKDKDMEIEALKQKSESLMKLLQDSPGKSDVPVEVKEKHEAEVLRQELERLNNERAELIATVQLKHLESVQYHAEIQRLTVLLNDEIRKQAQYRDSPVSLKEGESEQLPDDVRQQMEKLQTECLRMASSLTQEQTRNKYLQNEVQEQYEKESVLLKELERLRQHLVEVEDMYTQETLKAEAYAKDLLSKLAQAEEQIKNSSTAYTSASIRANQHVESLQGQARLITQQRDEIQQKLSTSEDMVQHHTAALRNLQIVLEQFQRDKEREIGAATERLHQQLQAEHRKQSELQAEIATLQIQLSEAKEGLSAGVRLGEQLEKKSQAITSLREEVSKLTTQLQEAEGRVQSASLNVEGKVDRYLVKNLVLGYFISPPNTRGQVLRVVATVLDFNQEERDRVGLDSASSSSSGWLKSILQPGKGPASTQSLSEAFVRFLENESRPQPQLRLLPEGQEATQGNSRSESPSSSTGGSQRRSPLLLSEVQLPTFTQFPVGRNSSSILKDVLKDS